MIDIEATNRKLGNKLKRLRIDAGFSRKQLADMFGLTVSAVGMYEQGRRTPSDDIKVKYSMMFDKSIDELFFWFKITLIVVLKEDRATKSV